MRLGSLNFLYNDSDKEGARGFLLSVYIDGRTNEKSGVPPNGNFNKIDHHPSA